MHPQLLRRFGDDWAVGAGPWLAGAGDHRSISSLRSPEVSAPKRRLAVRGNGGALQSPVVFPGPSGSPVSVYCMDFRPPGGASPFFAFPRKGLAPPGAAGGLHSAAWRSRVTLSKDVKKGLLETRSSHPHSAHCRRRRRRRLQVEKSPVGRNGRESPQGRPAPVPETFRERRLHCPAARALETRGLTAPGASASLAPRGTPLQWLWPRPAPPTFLSELIQLEAGWQRSKARLSVRA